MEDGNKSIVFMLAASFFFGLMNVAVKYLQDIPVAQIVFIRSLVMLFLVSVFLAKQKIKPFGNNKRLLLLRGFFGTLGISLFFYTLHTMPLASAVVVHYLTPIFTVIISVVLTRKNLHLVQWFFFAICFIGILVIRGFDVRVNSISLLLGICGTIGAAFAYNIIGVLKKTEHHQVIMLYFPLVTLPLAFIYILITGDWVWTNYQNWFVLLAIGVLTYWAQYFLTRAYQVGEVSKVSVISYLGIIYALFFGYWLFDEWYSLIVLLGIFLVAAGVIGNILFKSKVTPQ